MCVITRSKITFLMDERCFEWNICEIINMIWLQTLFFLIYATTELACEMYKFFYIKLICT